MSLAAIAEELLVGLRAQWPADQQLGGFEVEVGELVDVDVAALKAELERACPGVTVQIVRVDGLIRCLDCGAHYPAEESPCPVCGSGRGELVHGVELGVRRAWARAGG